ncbi:hypothetical protein SHIRM173S_13124 [Streptomyces hirsutus]
MPFSISSLTAAWKALVSGEPFLKAKPTSSRWNSPRNVVRDAGWAAWWRRPLIVDMITSIRPCWSAVRVAAFSA